MKPSSNGATPAPKPLSPELAAKARAAMALEPDRSKLPGAGQIAPAGGAQRTEFFSRLHPPMENGTGKAPGPKGKR
jgi:hypothetical protein